MRCLIHLVSDPSRHEVPCEYRDSTHETDAVLQQDKISAVCEKSVQIVKQTLNVPGKCKYVSHILVLRKWQLYDCFCLFVSFCSFSSVLTVMSPWGDGCGRRLYLSPTCFVRGELIFHMVNDAEHVLLLNPLASKYVCWKFLGMPLEFSKRLHVSLVC